jgi:hypothetical protein
LRALVETRAANLALPPQELAAPAPQGPSQEAVVEKVVDLAMGEEEEVEDLQEILELLDLVAVLEVQEQQQIQVHHQEFQLLQQLHIQLL